MTATPEQLAHYAALGVEAAEFAEMKRDAARYRWLRDEASSIQGSAPLVFECEIGKQISWFDALTGFHLDHEIDAEIAKFRSQP